MHMKSCIIAQRELRWFKLMNWTIFLFKRTSLMILALNFLLLGYLGANLSLVFHILKLTILILTHFFKIQKPLGLVQNSGLVSCTQDTFSKISYCIGTKIYTKLKLRMHRYWVLQLIKIDQLSIKFSFKENWACFT